MDQLLRLGTAGTLGLLAVTGLMGCSDPKEVSAKNFGKVIEQYLSQQGEQCIEKMTWPQKVPTGPKAMVWSDLPYSLDKQMAALEEVGLVSWTLVEVKELFGMRSPYKVYTLTEAGRKHLLERNIPNFPGPGSTKQTDLCWARMRLAEVRKWIGPKEFGAYAVVSVKYTYQLDGVPQWARNDSIGKAFPQIQRTLAGAGTQELNADLHLTNLGWEPIR